MLKKVLITTAIDYTNDVIHIGHLYQKVLADCYARYYRNLIGRENVRFLTGTDEHGQKVERAAKENNKTPKEFVDEIAFLDKKEQSSLNISYDRFIRTTDDDHKKTAADFFEKVYKAGFIYKAKYTGFYCEGCEEYKTAKDLVAGKCPLHQTKDIKKLSEENYFFKWSAFQDFLEKHFAKNPNFVLPKAKFNEMKSFLEQGVNDIPVSRPTLKWGIPLPIDKTQVIYVWFDALINYYTYAKPLGFWDNDTKIIHFLGKDNARWHTLLWPAMLKAAGKKLPDTVYVNSFLSLNGQKISKSLGNVIKASELTEKFGTDAVRYYLLKYGPLLEDADISLDKIKEVYNSELANNLGNLVSRAAKLLEEQNLKSQISNLKSKTENLKTKIQENMESYRPDLALQEIQLYINKLNKYIQEKKPWEKGGSERIKIMEPVLTDLINVATLLKPFMPETAERIKEIFSSGGIKASEPLFRRIGKG
ncbi:MAG: methionine--tRNA ligase [Patescibacteria group bacterium]|nr:methionine--tRNA ligase [Patescibacteria group bacterium]